MNHNAQTTTQTTTTTSTSTSSSHLKKVNIFAMCAAVNSCNLGYDLGVYTGAGDYIQDDLNLTDAELEIFIGSVNVFAMLGSLFSGISCDKYGRRLTFQWSAVIFIIGCSITALAHSYWTLMVGRFFIGIGIGVALAIDPLYISEISPADQRGYYVTWSELAINFGVLMGFTSLLVYAPMDDNLQWRLMISTGMIMPGVMLYLTWKVMPESPRWLVAKGRVDEAQGVLTLLNPEGTSSHEIVVGKINMLCIPQFM